MRKREPRRAGAVRICAWLELREVGLISDLAEKDGWERGELNQQHQEATEQEARIKAHNSAQADLNRQ